MSAPAPVPDRATATFVAPTTDLQDLPCFALGALGAPAALDLERVFLATGRSCAGLDRFRLTFAMNSIAEKVPVPAQGLTNSLRSSK